MTWLTVAMLVLQVMMNLVIVLLIWRTLRVIQGRWEASDGK